MHALSGHMPVARGQLAALEMITGQLLLCFSLPLGFVAVAAL
jgi:hypothetical protein